MGSTMAPNYANLYVGLFEQNFISNGLQNSFLPNIVLWRRYIDDIFMLWSGTENQLLQFYSLLNTSDENLRFTVNYDDSCVSFLDICIIRDGKKIITDLYRKPTDRNTLCMDRATILQC